jgi:putative Ca2+/H+ antiporter (TMEM165/GDT1 family)
MEAFLVSLTAIAVAEMPAANAPVVFLGKAFADRLPMMAIHYTASALFLILGAVFLFRALWR